MFKRAVITSRLDLCKMSNDKPPAINMICGSDAKLCCGQIRESLILDELAQNTKSYNDKGFYICFDK